MVSMRVSAVYPPRLTRDRPACASQSKTRCHESESRRTQMSPVRLAAMRRRASTRAGAVAQRLGAHVREEQHVADGRASR